MEEWKEYKYTDLATIIGGGTPKTPVSEYWNGEIPCLSVKDFVSATKYVYDTEKYISGLGLLNSSTKLLEKDDIIISARGTVGAMAMIPYPMCFNQSCFGLQGKSIVDKNFLYYLTQTKIDELKKSAHGSVFDTITRETFDNLPCVVPPLQLQQKITNILSSLDDKIELNRRINDNLGTNDKKQVTND
jgi:type I restriction modification DNA specificity domain protein